MVVSRRHLPVAALVAVLGALAAVALLTAHAAACDAQTDLRAALPLLTPALALLAPLLLGRYLGEERITRLAGSRRPRRRRAPHARFSARPRPRAALARGGELLGARMARRGPPAARLA
jgi:hypothetical protein